MYAIAGTALTFHFCAGGFMSSERPFEPHEALFCPLTRNTTPPISLL